MSSTLTYVRTYLARILVVVGLLATLVSWYFASPQVDAIANELNIWNMNIETFTLFVGLITISARYINSIRARDSLWPYRLYAIVLMVVWIIMGMRVGIYSDLYQTAFLSTKITLHIAILGQLVFFITSAGYRVLRIRNFRTALYTICFLLVVICNAPWMLGPFPVVDKISFWLLNNPAAGGSRALLLTGGIGGVVLGVRLLLGIEKGALRATEE
jgi:hypothetical protein